MCVCLYIVCVNQSINQSSLRLLITPLTRTQRGLQEQKYKHEK